MNIDNNRTKRKADEIEGNKPSVTKEEMGKTLKNMLKGKAVGPDDISAKVWKCLGQAGTELLEGLCNEVKISGRMPDEWKSSILIPI